MKMKIPSHIRARLDQNYLESKRVHEDSLSEKALIRRIAEQNRIQTEKDRLYDLENTSDETFSWEECDND